MQVRKFPFKQHMIVIRAGNVARATRPSAAMIKRVMHRSKNQRMLSHAEIIVGTPHADGLGSFGAVVLGPWKRSSLPLKICEHPVTTFGAQLVKLSVEEVAVVHCISCRRLAPVSAKQASPNARADGVLKRAASYQFPCSCSFKRAFDISIPHARPTKTCLRPCKGMLAHSRCRSG